jgi:hypothetical protein
MESQRQRKLQGSFKEISQVLQDKMRENAVKKPARICY